MSARGIGIIIFFFLIGCISYIIFGKTECIQKKVRDLVLCFSVIAVLLPIILPEKVAEYIDPNIEKYKEENNSLKEINEGLEAENENLKTVNEELKEENYKLQQQFISVSDESSAEKQAISFEKELNVLYDGSRYNRYDGDNKFEVGGKEYRYGFTIGCDRGIANLGPGYVLFNLDGKYSKMTCEAGRVGSDKGDATVIVTSESGINESYPLSGEIASQSIEIDLKNTEDLKIMLDANSTLTYGFFDICFYE